MTWATKLNEQQRGEIVHALTNGEQHRHIAARYGVSRSLVSQVAVRSGQRRKFYANSGERPPLYQSRELHDLYALARHKGFSMVEAKEIIARHAERRGVK